MDLLQNLEHLAVGRDTTAGGPIARLIHHQGQDQGPDTLPHLTDLTPMTLGTVMNPRELTVARPAVTAGVAPLAIAIIAVAPHPDVVEATAVDPHTAVLALDHILVLAATHAPDLVQGTEEVVVPAALTGVS